MDSTQSGARSGQVVPFPRNVGDPANPRPEPIPDVAEWTYNRIGGQPGWKFTGQIEYVGGTESNRMSAQLAAVIRELLEWATDQSRDQNSEAA